MTVDTTMGAYDERNVLLARYAGLDVNDPRTQAMVAVCRHYDFDPLLKHVVILKGEGGGLWITRDGYLHVAHRSGQLDGIVVEQEPHLTDEDGRQEWRAVVTVWRKDMAHPFTYPGRYPRTGRNRDYAPEMALKNAEAHALRRAFDVTGAPALDERQPDAELADDGTPSRPARGGGLSASQAVQVGTHRPDPERASERRTDTADEPIGEGGEKPRGQAGERPGERAEPAPPADEPPVRPDRDRRNEPSVLLDTSSDLAKAMYAGIREAGIPRERVHEFMSECVGREINSSKELTVNETYMILEYLPGPGDP